jgi:hypothetical protein
VSACPDREIPGWRKGSLLVTVREPELGSEGGPGGQDDPAGAAEGDRNEDR